MYKTCNTSLYYVYEANAILVKPMKNKSDDSFVEAYKEMYEDLKARGFKPTLNVTDNKCVLKQNKSIPLHKMKELPVS